LQKNKPMWHPEISRFENIYVAFQAEIYAEAANNHITLYMFASNAYRAYLNGMEIMEGPARFDSAHPEYDESSFPLAQGRHVLTIIVHYFGVSTRFAAPETSAFLQCELLDVRGAIPLQWLCKELDAYAHIGRRLNGQLGWMELCDVRLLPSLEVINQGPDWFAPMEVSAELGVYRPKQIKDSQFLPKESLLLLQGSYTDRFGYRDDDPPVRFMLRDLNPDLPPDGIWFRYDFSLIGLYYPDIVLDVPSGTVVEASYSEALTDGKAIPFITLSASSSCSMDRWITGEGLQTLRTFSPRGFRFLELHIAASAEQVRSVGVSARQRTYFASPEGSFHCSDPLLNKIWLMSVNTLQACCEDALTDTPTRERGQWLGDAVAVGMETISVSFNDLSLIRRSLVQAAYCRREDGLAAGLYPGQNTYVSSFALLWISGCMRYFQHSGDRLLLEELYETAVQTIEVFNSRLTPKGVYKLDVWDFIDWGHIIDKEEINVALNLLLLGAIRDLTAWEQELGMTERSMERQKQAIFYERIAREAYVNPEGLLAQSVPAETGNNTTGSVPPMLRTGYHATVLGLWLNLFDTHVKPVAVEFVKQHILSCFPNHPDAPRLAHPEANHHRLITPYFMHFTLHALLEAGEVDFVLEQYRVCWGWMLEQGATTLLEVFDTRWSHCHAWSGCPAWQLSRHVLGLAPDETGDPYCFNWHPKTGSLEYVEGKLPLVNAEGHIEIKWVRIGSKWIYKLSTEQPLHIKLTKQLNIEQLEADGVKHAASTAEIDVLHSLKLIFSSQILM
jgi:alpha-L-rhamnosidase